MEKFHEKCIADILVCLPTSNKTPLRHLLNTTVSFQRAEAQRWVDLFPYFLLNVY